MGIDLIKRILIFLVICLAQVLVLNHIHLLGCATPLLYIYIVLLFKRNYPKWAILLWCFAIGLCIDTFSNTPGIGAASMTLLGLLQPYILEPFIPRDSEENLEPGMKSLGVSSFVYYTIICVFIYNTTFFSLEAFNFYNWQQWLAYIAGSTILTSILILVIENLRRK